MARKKRRDAPEWQWEQSLIDHYYDFRHRELLEPLYEQFQRWKAGDLSHADLHETIHHIHKQNQQLYSFFSNKRDFLTGAIQMDDEWFDVWIKDHPRPSD